MQTIKEERSKHGSQGWRVRRTVNFAGHKLRATIYQDSYEFQSHYKLELFNPRELKWNTVYDISPDEWYKHLPYSGWTPGVPSSAGNTAKYIGNVEVVLDELLAYGQDLLEGVEA